MHPIVECLADVLFVIVLQGGITDEVYRVQDASLRKELEQKVAKIRAEVADSKTDWAGQYYGELGVDTYATLLLAPKEGIVYLEHGNSGIFDGNFGDLGFKDEVLLSKFKHPNGSDTQRTLNGDLSAMAVVRWGSDMMLVPVSRLHGFCLRARQPAEWPYLLRQLYRKSNDEPDGEIVLPEQYSPLRELPAIEAVVSRVIRTEVETRPNRWELVKQTVELSCGLRDKVFVGMDFSYNGILDLRVIDTSEESSTAVMKALVSKRRVSKRRKTAKELEVGMVVRTAKF